MNLEPLKLAIRRPDRSVRTVSWKDDHGPFATTSLRQAINTLVMASSEAQRREHPGNQIVFELLNPERNLRTNDRLPLIQLITEKIRAEGRRAQLCPIDGCNNSLVRMVSTTTETGYCRTHHRVDVETGAEAEGTTEEAATWAPADLRTIYNGARVRLMGLGPHINGDSWASWGLPHELSTDYMYGVVTGVNRHAIGSYEMPVTMVVDADSPFAANRTYNVPIHNLEVQQQ